MTGIIFSRKHKNLVISRGLRLDPDPKYSCIKFLFSRSSQSYILRHRAH